MAQSLDSAQLELRQKFTYKNTLNGRSVSDILNVLINPSLTNGTGANKAQHVFYDERTLATGNSESLDLAGGLTGAFGALTFTKVKFIVIALVTATTGYTLKVGGAASNAMSSLFADASDILVVQAGGFVALAAPVDGYTVTANTGDLLKIENPAGGNATYRILIVGEGSCA